MSERATPNHDERSLAALAHLSILLNVITAVGGLLTSGIIYLKWRERSGLRSGASQPGAFLPGDSAISRALILGVSPRKVDHNAASAGLNEFVRSSDPLLMRLRATSRYHNSLWF